ncbi:MAG: translocation/assembly module TamB domain-containing protein [Pseudomonadota bacterium]
MAAIAQDDDEGFIAGLIEDNLSAGERSVNIVGFEGALSSQATIEQLTISDADGVWLALEDIVMSWNRGALLRGAIDIEELSAARIVVSRAPIAEPSPPSPETSPFSLPELPVSIAFDALAIDRIELGEVFLGEPVAFAINGNAALADGQGSAAIAAERLDGPRGTFEINGNYNNASRVLDLLLRLDEGADGIAVTLLDLPSAPPVALNVAGTGPLDAFAADLGLATDGQDRLAGTFSLTGADGGQRIALDVGGDISPLFAPEYGAFFGNDAHLAAEVLQSADGRIDVPELTLQAGRIALDGTVAIASGGWPERISLTGGITDTGNDPILLPLSGPRTFVDGVDLRIAYNGVVSENWEATLQVDGLSRPGLQIATLGLDGGGIIQPGNDGGVAAFTANLDYGADGLALDDAGAAEAFGSDITGEFALVSRAGQPTRINRLTLNGAGLDVNANATIAGLDNGFETNANVSLNVAGLARFATIVGQDIAGAAALALQAQVSPDDGGFDLTLTGQTTDLSVGIAEADAILAGTGTIAARAVRDAEGTRLEDLRIRTDEAEITADANLTSEGTDAAFTADLRDLALVLPDLQGAANITGQITQSPEGILGFDIDAAVPDADLTADGTLTPAAEGQTLNIDLRAALSDLATYAALAGRPISGAATVELGAVLLGDMQRFDADISAVTQDVQIGDARLDPLITGRGLLRGQVSRTGEDRGSLRDLSLRTPAMTLGGDAAVDLSGSNAADLRLIIFDAGVLDPSLDGPIGVTINASPAADDATAAQLVVSGPGTDVSADLLIASPANARQISGEVAANVAALGAFAGLAGQPIAGSIDLTAAGEVAADLSSFDASVNLRSEDLAIGNPTADALLAGTGRINATFGQADGLLSVRTLEVSTREVSVVAALNGAAGAGQGRFNASLRDVGVLTDQISGPIRATGSANLDDAGNWGIDTNATGPGGLGAQIIGTYAPDGTLNLDVDGSAPLALANTAIDPRRVSGLANFDLAVNGPPALSSLSGRITFENGRLAAPNLGEALSGITGQIGLGGNQANIDLQARVESGGGVSVSGPVGLAGGNNADITLRINNVVVQDPDLYSTTVDGALTLRGPLTGGARIAGAFDLGQTDVQVPSSSISSLGALPEVRHVGANADTRRTLQRAGVSTSGRDIAAEDSGGNGSGPAFPLDIVINAPSRIFIRGRGLDAELGGQLTIGGTSANVIPVGRFSLIRGRIDIVQHRFQLTEGVASLQGSFDPFIRLVATTETDTGTVINIIVEGPAGAPEVRFESVPELPQDEVLAQLIFGRDLDSISPLQAVQLASAISTLAGRGGGTLNNFRESIGLDDFDVTTDEEGNAAVRAGAYLSENVYTDVTVTSDGGTEINLNLDITDEITARGGVDEEGETSLGVFFERDY